MVKIMSPGSDSSHITGSCTLRHQAMTSVAYNFRALGSNEGIIVLSQHIRIGISRFQGHHNVESSPASCHDCQASGRCPSKKSQRSSLINRLPKAAVFSEDLGR